MFPFFNRPFHSGQVELLQHPALTAADILAADADEHESTEWRDFQRQRVRSLSFWRAVSPPNIVPPCHQFAAAAAGAAAVATVAEAAVAYASKLMSDASASSTLSLSKKVRAWRGFFAR